MSPNPLDDAALERLNMAVNTPYVSGRHDDGTIVRVGDLSLILTRYREMREALEPFHAVASTWGIGIAEGEPAPRMISFSMSWNECKKLLRAFRARPDGGGE